MSAPSFSVRQALSFAWRRTWSNFWRLLLVALVGIAIYVLVTLVSGVLESLPVDAADPSVPDPTELLDDPDTFLLDPAVYRTNPLTYLTLRNGINLVVTGLQVVVTLYLFLGLTRIAVAVTAGAKVEILQLFAARGFGRYVGGTVLHALLLVAGIGVPVGIGVVISAFTNQSIWTSIATIIGYVIATVVTLGFIFFGFVIADKDSRVVAGMRESHELVRPHILRLLFLIGLLGIGMGVLGAVAWLVGTRTAGIGFLISLPVALPLLIGLFAFSTGSAYRQLSGHAVQ